MTKPKLPWVRMVAYLPFALVNTGLGILLLLTPVTFPIGLILLILAGFPYARWMSKKITADVEYAERDHTTNEGEVLPWETESTIGLSDDELINIILNTHGRGSSS